MWCLFFFFPSNKPIDIWLSFKIFRNLFHSGKASTFWYSIGVLFDHCMAWFLIVIENIHGLLVAFESCGSFNYWCVCCATNSDQKILYWVFIILLILCMFMFCMHHCQWYTSLDRVEISDTCIDNFFNKNISSFTRLFIHMWVLYTMQAILLTHWGRVTHISINKLTIIGSDNGLSPDQRQAFIWTNAWILLIGNSGTSFSGIVIKIHNFPSRKGMWKCRLENVGHFGSVSMC